MTETHDLKRGSRDYRRANLALFFAGFVTFSTLYDFQPLFPNLVAEFGITPTVASLSLSLATFALAWSLPVSGSLSDALGRKGLMGLALFGTALLTLASVCSTSLGLLLGLRLLQGCVLAGVPAVAMAYLREEVEPQAIGSAMGLYIAGNALGGMTGRILTALLADLLPWRGAVGIIGLLGLVMALVFLLILPPSRNFQRRPFRLGPLSASLFEHLRHPGLRCLFLLALTCMGGFVTLYNYVTFRLLGPEFNLSQTQVAAIFLAYAFGAGGSSAIGLLADRLGRSQTLFYGLAIMALGLLLTLVPGLPAVIVGIVVFTIGFFGVHTVASSWVGLLAHHARGQASALYLFFYYLGSSLAGTAGGWFYARWEWAGVCFLILLLLSVAWLVGLKLSAFSRQESASAGLTTSLDLSQLRRP